VTLLTIHTPAAERPRLFNQTIGVVDLTPKHHFCTNFRQALQAWGVAVADQVTHNHADTPPAMGLLGLTTDLVFVFTGDTTDRLADILRSLPARPQRTVVLVGAIGRSDIQRLVQSSHPGAGRLVLLGWNPSINETKSLSSGPITAASAGSQLGWLLGCLAFCADHYYDRFVLPGSELGEQARVGGVTHFQGLLGFLDHCRPEDAGVYGGVLLGGLTMAWGEPRNLMSGIGASRARRVLGYERYNQGLAVLVQSPDPPGAETTFDPRLVTGPDGHQFAVARVPGDVWGGQGVALVSLGLEWLDAV
jgi:hypothetical protein